MELSGDQIKVLDVLLGWSKENYDKNGFITMGGYAGTGKTTLIGRLRQKLRDENPKLKVAFACFTGKAARVLKNKLIEAEAVYDEDSVGTIHSLIYSPIENDKKEIIGWRRQNEVVADLIIIDEASMVDENIWNDLRSYGKPIIAVGDHGQLPPINGSFNLMERPMVKLEQIHRQVAENPIIKLSIMARIEGKIDPGKYGVGVAKYDKKEYETQERVEELLRNYSKDSLVLCGYNATRMKLNSFIRQALEFEFPTPCVSDRVICLRNNHTAGIYNGMLGVIAEIKRKNDEWWEAKIEMDPSTSSGQEEIYEGLISAAQFEAKTAMNFTNQRYRIIKGDLFDFGYALTVHKAQGSQSKRVILFEERFGKMSDDEWRRWLYTGVTRAEEELYIVG